MNDPRRKKWFLKKKHEVAYLPPDEASNISNGDVYEIYVFLDEMLERLRAIESREGLL